MNMSADCAEYRSVRRSLFVIVFRHFAALHSGFCHGVPVKSQSYDCGSALPSGKLLTVSNDDRDMINNLKLLALKRKQVIMLLVESILISNA
jgi:hypothetical protein